MGGWDSPHFITMSHHGDSHLKKFVFFELLLAWGLLEHDKAPW
jgi:hypothetical protein